jgi:hypothetical protein
MFEPMKLQAQVESLRQRRRTGAAKRVTLCAVVVAFPRVAFFLVVQRRSEQFAIEYECGRSSVPDRDDCAHVGAARVLA